MLIFFLLNFQLLSLSFISPFFFVLLDLFLGLSFLLFQSLLFHFLHELFLVNLFRFLGNLNVFRFFLFFYTFIFGLFQFISDSTNFGLRYLNSRCFFDLLKRCIMTNLILARSSNQSFICLVLKERIASKDSRVLLELR